MITSKKSKKTSGIINVDHLHAMIDAMEKVEEIDIVTEMSPDNDYIIQSVVATVTNKTGTKTKEIFRALIGSTGMYLARYNAELFTRVS
jgi:hypothetical protein